MKGRQGNIALSLAIVSLIFSVAALIAICVVYSLPGPFGDFGTFTSEDVQGPFYVTPEFGRFPEEFKIPESAPGDELWIFMEPGPIGGGITLTDELSDDWEITDADGEWVDTEVEISKD